MTAGLEPAKTEFCFGARVGIEPTDDFDRAEGAVGEGIEKRWEKGAVCILHFATLATLQRRLHHVFHPREKRRTFLIPQPLCYVYRVNVRLGRVNVDMRVVKSHPLRHNLDWILIKEIVIRHDMRGMSGDQRPLSRQLRI